ncbi:MAG: glycosyltransferase [Planctomycetota bacterium]|nr:glycosyltransferase [Planctomycetota bacterium]
MRILLATSSYPLHPGDGTAAAGLFCRDLACLLRDRGLEVTVFTQRRPGLVRDDERLTVIRFPWWGRGRPVGSLDARRPADLILGAGLLALGAGYLIPAIRKHRIERVLAFWALPAGAWARVARKLTGVPYDCWVLGSDVWRGGSSVIVRPLLRSILRDAGHVYADGEELRVRASELAERPAELLHSVRQGPIPTPSARRIRNRFVFIGRWAHAKGADLLPAAADILRQAGWEFELVMRGDGPLAGKIRSDIRRFDLGSRVRIGGPASTEEASHLIGSAGWVLIPSRRESIPLILWDALRADRPVVATDVGDLGNAVRERGAGILARVASAPALAEAMARALGSDRFAVPFLGREGIPRLERSADRIVEAFRGVKS